MAELLVDLIQVLKTKQGQERITREEVDLLNDCKSKSVRSFVVSSPIAAALVWVASRRLNTFFRFNLAGGAGFITGMWRFKRSNDSCVDHILSMDGSRMQHELRRIVLERYGNNPQRMKSFSRHFYSEEVLSDSSQEHVKSVYRQRNLYREDERVAESKTYGAPDTNKESVYGAQSDEESSSFKQKKPSMGMRKSRILPSITMEEYGDPLEVLFGISIENESHQLDDSADTTKSPSRSQKRAHRSHRHRHRRGVPSSLENA